MSGKIDCKLIRVPRGLRYFISRSNCVLLFNPDLGTFASLTKEEFADLRNLVSDQDRGIPVESTQYHNLAKCASKLIIRRVVYYGAFMPIIDTEISPVPKVVYWETTKGCSLRCIYCYMNASTAANDELSTEEVQLLIDEMAALGVQELVFTGGEPLIRKDIWEIARYARKKDLATGLITNGTLIFGTDIAQQIKDCFNTVTTSLDGSSAESNDIHRGRGSFDIIVHGIKLLNKVGVKPFINSVVSSLNVSSISQLTSYVTNNIDSCGHRITTISKIGRGEIASDEMDEWDVYMNLHKMLSALATSVPVEILIPGLHNRSLLPAMNCGMGSGELYVDSRGNVFPCKLVTTDDFLGGNVRSTTLEDILSDEPINSIRNCNASSFSTCGSCFVRWLCGGGCRGIHLSSSGDWMQNSETFCQILRHRIITLLWLFAGHPDAISDEQSYDPHFVSNHAL